MRRIHFVVGLFVGLATLPADSACSHTNESGGDVAPATMIGLSVTNDNFLDMDVFAVSGGVSTRLGTVTGNGKGNFRLDPSLASRDLRIVAAPIGGNGRASSGEVAVSPGQVIDFRIGSLLRNSTVQVRSP
jgi:hypothetical protein